MIFCMAAQLEALLSQQFAHDAEATLHSEKASFGLRVQEILEDFKLPIVDVDLKRPWGGFFRIDREHAPQFAELFFRGTDFEIPDKLDVSPKILLVAPQMRLSWQVHERRSEYWRAVGGAVGYKVSETDQEPAEVTILHKDEAITVPQGTRHRLIGLRSWGIIAEAWIHTELTNPSTEEDNRRIQDDFKRT